MFFVYFCYFTGLGPLLLSTRGGAIGMTHFPRMLSLEVELEEQLLMASRTESTLLLPKKSLAFHQSDRIRAEALSVLVK